MEQQLEPGSDAGSAESRVEWIPPEVDRLVAGGAETGGDTSTDGIDIFS